MTSWLATGPPVMCCVAPASVFTSVAWKFWIAPAATRTIAPITAIGSRIRNVIRVRSTQKLPIVAVALPPSRLSRHPVGEPTDERDGDGNAHGRGQEVLHRETGHLGDVRHRRLARVRLPVRVRDEADRGVPGQRGADAGELRAARIGQVGLDPLDQVEDKDRYRGEREHGSRVHAPRLFAVGVHADRFVDHAFDASVFAPGDHAMHVVAEWLVYQRKRDDESDDEQDACGRRIHQILRCVAEPRGVIRNAPGTSARRSERSRGRPRE